MTLEEAGALRGKIWLSKGKNVTKFVEIKIKNS
jgi:hypothetical protein